MAKPLTLGDRLTVRLPTGMLKRIDERRGDVPRQEAVREALLAWLERPAKECG